jgi:hypothetical protein
MNVVHAQAFSKAPKRAQGLRVNADNTADRAYDGHQTVDNVSGNDSYILPSWRVCRVVAAAPHVDRSGDRRFRPRPSLPLVEIRGTLKRPPGHQRSSAQPHYRK